MVECDGSIEVRRARIRHLVRSTLVTLLVILVLFWAVFTFAGRPYRVPTGSMEDAIMADDRVLAERVSYYVSDPQPGDIVTFEDPETPGRFLVKRVIAVGGQAVSFVSGTVTVDGGAQNASYVKGKSYPAAESAEKADINYPYVVPEDELWVMGDNRENSRDSRYFGSIPVSSVTGKAFFTYWPLDRMRLLG